MQSKLPVRIKKKLEETKCNNLLELMIQNPGDAYCSFCTQRVYSIATQTESSTIESEKKSYGEVKGILVNINKTLETILETLQDKKELLYIKLQEEGVSCKKTKFFHNKNKIDKFKKKNNQLIRKFSYDVGWPDISRLYCGQSPWLKDYMQKIAVGLAQYESNMIICPRSHSWIFTARPNSCPNINYFQPMGNLLERRKIIGSSELVLFDWRDLQVETEHQDEKEIQ